MRVILYIYKSITSIQLMKQAVNFRPEILKEPTAVNLNGTDALSVGHKQRFPIRVIFLFFLRAMLDRR